MSEVRTELIVLPDGGSALRVPRLKLVVLEGPDRGVELASSRTDLRVGTERGMDLVLTDPTVSRHHCTLAVDGPQVRARDHSSSNGTIFESARLRDASLPIGALLRLGNTTVRVTTDEDTIVVPLSTRDRFGGLIGRSTRMREVFAILERVAPTGTTVLVEGESGTGKELAAEGIHATSPRADGPFVVFDCGAVPRELVESALFGHVRGAFTGAIADREGVFGEADGGTLFLDEIGELPLDLQPKLLRALEKREIRQVGAAGTRKVDVRIVAATNRSLHEDVNAGRFRADLFYRLAVVTVALPPLRARPEDIALLVSHFVQQLAPDGSGGKTLSARAVDALAARPWPGNVRELRNAVERALSLGASATLLTAGGPAQGQGHRPDESNLPYHEALRRAIEQFDRRYLSAVLQRTGGNLTAAAREAGVNRKLIQRRVKQLGLTRPDGS